jgi:hypothetical protein
MTFSWTVFWATVVFALLLAFMCWAYDESDL